MVCCILAFTTLAVDFVAQCETQRTFSEANVNSLWFNDNLKKREKIEL